MGISKRAESLMLLFKNHRNLKRKRGSNVNFLKKSVDNRKRLATRESEFQIKISFPNKLFHVSSTQSNTNSESLSVPHCMIKFEK